MSRRANHGRPGRTRFCTGRRPVTFALTCLLTVAVIATPVAPAQAAQYPSWSDVEKARGNEAAKQAQIAQLTALISGLEADVATATALKAERAASYEAAQAAFDEANFRAQTLQKQADEATARALASRQQAGRIAASLVRAGGQDLGSALLLDQGNASNLLSTLGTMSKLSGQIDVVYARAAQDSNTAKSLTGQANVAKDLLGALAKQTQDALTEAINASAALDAKLAEQQQNATTLAAQLTVLQENRAATEADFQKGEQVRLAAEAAARAAAAKVAAEAAAAKAAAEAAAASNGSVGGVAVSANGWFLPVSGWISDPFGPRPDRPVSGVGEFHYGTDLAASCGRNIYAAASGTVLYAGDFGTFGNWVLIDNGNGVQTGYAHNGALLVSAGQTVSGGSVIAQVGSTGASSGCHLHFEVRQGGARIDPVPFMSARGISLG